ncbi:MAG: hypothetical protein Q9166_000059 [cf. Caloplaca sp. 2 TL-2023]
MESLLPGFWNRGSWKEADQPSEKQIASSSPNNQQLPSSSRAGPRRSIEEDTKDEVSDTQELEHLRSRLRQKESELSQINHMVTTEIQNWHTWAQHNGKELDSLRQRNSSLDQELQACKDDLFKMQPRTKVPDSDVAKAYDDLHEHISSWVEGETSRFEINFRKHHKGPLPDLFFHKGSLAAKKFLSSYPTPGGEYFVRGVIQDMLHKKVFADEILLHGLDEPGTELLRRIEQSTGKTKPSREAEAIAIWRSDTLSALSTTSDFKQNRRKCYSQMLDAIFKEVARFFPIIEKTHGSMERFLEKVLSPAVKLASTLHLSPTKYEFVPKMRRVAFSGSDSVVALHHPSLAKLIDVETGKTLKVDSPIQSDEKGNFGMQLIRLASALYRQDPGQNGLLLVKEIGLVKLHKPLGRRRAATARQGPVEQASLI